MNPFDEFFMPFVDWKNFPFRLNDKIIMKTPLNSIVLTHRGQERAVGEIQILTYKTEFKSITFPLSTKDDEHSTKWNLRFTLERCDNSVDLS